MALVFDLCAHGNQPVAYDQALPQLVIDLRWWCPLWWLAFGSKPNQHLCIQEVYLTAPRKRASIQCHLARIDDTYRIGSVMQRDRKCDPIATGCFKDNEGCIWADTGFRQRRLQLRITCAG